MTDLPFTPMNTEQCNRVYRAPGCMDLPALYDPEQNHIFTYWRPNAEALAALNAGIPLRIGWVGDQVIPISIDVEAI